MERGGGGEVHIFYDRAFSDQVLNSSHYTHYTFKLCAWTTNAHWDFVKFHCGQRDKKHWIIEFSKGNPGNGVPA